MCVLVQHFLCPLSSNIISGVLKSFNSEELQREQLAVNSEELQQQWYTKSRVLFVGKVNYNDVSECSILPFEDAIPRASPMLLWTTLPLPLIYILRSLRSQAFRNGDSMAVPSPSQVSMCPSPDDSTSVRWRTILLCSVEDYWCPPLESPCLLRYHLDILPCNSDPIVLCSYLRFHYLSCASSNFNPVCRLVSRVIELRCGYFIWFDIATSCLRVQVGRKL
jgi:hypothetical protein